MEKNKTNLTNKTSFINQLLDFGICKIVKSLDFKIATGFIILYYFDQRYDFKIISHNNDDTYITTIIAASSILFALTTTSLSIIISFSSSSFVKFLQENNQLASILFPFYIGNGAYLMSVVFSLSYFLINKDIFAKLHNYLFVGAVAVFIYALVNTFYLLSSIIRFGYFVGSYEEKLKNSQ